MTVLKWPHCLFELLPETRQHLRIVLQTNWENQMLSHREAYRFPSHELQECRVWLPEDAEVHKEERPRVVLPLHSFRLPCLGLSFLRSCHILSGSLLRVPSDKDPELPIRCLVHSRSKPDRPSFALKSRQHGVSSPL